MDERIKQIRKHFGLTLDAFGARIGLTKSAISRMENGYNPPQEQTLRLICREFGVSYAWLKDGVGDMIEERDEDDDVNRLMLGESEFAKSVFRALAKLPPEAWDLFQQFVETLKADQKKPGD